VIKEISQQKLSLIPVVGKQMKYLGVVTLTDLIHELSHYNAVNQPGGIIVLQINEHDYSLSEMAKIVESNDAIILSSYLYSLPNSTSMEVTLKVNKMDISPILQTFERYGYQIKTSIFETHDEEMDERFEGLMRFLNI
jgi:CBS domain-containing protein